MCWYPGKRPKQEIPTPAASQAGSRACRKARTACRKASGQLGRRGCAAAQHQQPLRLSPDDHWAFCQPPDHQQPLGEPSNYDQPVIQPLCHWPNRQHPPHGDQNFNGLCPQKHQGDD